MRPISKLGAALAVFAAIALAATAFAQLGPPGGTIYAHDVAYQTVGTPAHFPNHGKFDTIYVLGDGLANVSDAAPGDRDYNGGRWEVRPVTFETIAPMQFTNAEDILAAADAGQISIGDVAMRFECPLIRKR
jgi:hypothetical protein